MKQIFTYLLFCVLATSAMAQTYNVTFKVNMNEVAAAYTTPEVNGTFNGWCGGCNPLADGDGDGIWEATIALEAGTYEYKFAYDTWAGQENLIEGSPCTITAFGFTNRTFTLGAADIVLDPVCWGSCDACDGIVLDQMDLPVTFDAAGVDYGLIGFGGAEASSIVIDPTDAGNMVAKVIKSATAELWAGTTVTDGAGSGFASEVPFTVDATTMTVRVWSPDAGIQVRLKVEDHTDPTKSVETEATTTVAGSWEVLTFDFANEAPGTAEINYGYFYDKASIFFNFGVTGAVAGEKTYYFDDVEFGADGDPVEYNVTFSVNMNEVAPGFTTPEVNGSFNGWCGGCNPLSDPEGDGIWSTTIPILEGNYEYKFAYDAWAGQEELTPGDPCTITLGGFTNRELVVSGGDVTQPLVCWGSCTDCGVVELDQMDLPVTFDAVGVNYGLIGFGGAEASTIVVDPTDATNMVAEVIKSATAELWAGTTVTDGAGSGFANEVPFTADANIMTVRVWSPDAGIQVRLKVEEYLDPTKSVETEATTTVAGDWETLTFDFANEAPGTAEINYGYNYNKASIFFNFGVTGAVAGEKTYYFDDVMFGEPVVAVNYNVTFNVNMNEVAAAFTTPEVNGTFNGWCGGCNPLSDPDGDGIWSTTLSIPEGTYQFKYAYDAWAGSENLIDGAECTITDGGFVNRALEVTGDMVMDPVCWGSCLDCGAVDTYDVLFTVDMNEVGAAFTTPEVNGTFNGWCGGCAPMSDPDGDNVWELVIPLEAGTYEYKFAYDTWAGSETLIEGDPCTITAFGFTNRALVVSEDVALDTVCWGSCTSCEATVPAHIIKFQVDMSTVAAAFTTPEVNGTFNGWCGGCAPMSDVNGDDIWELDILLPEGTYEYKFAFDAWAGQEELTEGDVCTITSDGFTNRSLTVAGPATLDVVCWAKCTACNVGINEEIIGDVNVWPQPAKGVAYLTFEDPTFIAADAMITDITGRLIQSTTIANNNHEFDLNGFVPGIYQVVVIKNGQILYSNSLSVQ
jgi:1,4-alpha-glucan branching enzyme